MPLSEPSFFVLFGRFSAGAFLLTGSRFGARCVGSCHLGSSGSLNSSGFLCFFAVASVVLSVVSFDTDGSLHTVMVLQLLLFLMLTAQDLFFGPRSYCMVIRPSEGSWTSTSPG